MKYTLIPHEGYTEPSDDEDLATYDKREWRVFSVRVEFTLLQEARSAESAYGMALDQLVHEFETELESANVVIEVVE